jgi:hypothetical protein
MYVFYIKVCLNKNTIGNSKRNNTGICNIRNVYNMIGVECSNFMPSVGAVCLKNAMISKATVERQRKSQILQPLLMPIEA